MSCGERVPPSIVLTKFAEAIGELNYSWAMGFGERGVVEVVVTKGTARRMGIDEELGHVDVLTSTGIVRIKVMR